MARPKLEITYEQLKALCRMKPTKKDCAAFFNCSEDTIEKRCAEYEGLSFTAFRDKYMVHTRFDLIRKALKQAEKNPATMIFCLKNICKWTDRIETENTNKEIKINIDKDDSEL
jgi:AraC-like DNA-binding protein